MSAPNNKDLINWTGLSRRLAGNDESIRKNNVPKKYKLQVDFLLKMIGWWSEAFIKK